MVQLTGPNLSSPHLRVTARFHGRCLPTELLPLSMLHHPSLQQAHFQHLQEQARQHQQQHQQQLHGGAPGAWILGVLGG